MASSKADTLRALYLNQIGGLADELREEGVLSREFVRSLGDRLIARLDKAYEGLLSESLEDGEVMMGLYVLEVCGVGGNFDDLYFFTHTKSLSEDEFSDAVEEGRKLLGDKEEESREGEGYHFPSGEIHRHSDEDIYTSTMEDLADWLVSEKDFKYLGLNNIDTLPWLVGKVFVYGYS